MRKKEQNKKKTRKKRTEKISLKIRHKYIKISLSMFYCRRKLTSQNSSPYGVPRQLVIFWWKMSKWNKIY